MSLLLKPYVENHKVGDIVRSIDLSSETFDCFGIITDFSSHPCSSPIMVRWLNHPTICVQQSWNVSRSTIAKV